MRAAHPTSDPMAHTLLVLLVDDDRDTLEMYGLGLELLGMRRATAATGTEGLALAEQIAPDVVVTDLTLPDVDGIELCQRLRGSDRTRHIPVIALTGRSEDDEIARVTSAGADRVIVKPCTPEELAQVIGEVLGERGGNTNEK